MNKVIIIAEAGVNHNGEFEIAKKLIDAASEANVDYVKFQTFKAKNIVTKKAKKAKYQINNLKENDDSQFFMLKSLELPYKWHQKLIDYANLKNLKFLSTGFDTGSIDFLDDLGIQIFKIPSGEITNKPYLEHVAKKNKEIIISTGMATMLEVKEAVGVLLNAGALKKAITVLHCNSEYPTPMEDVNLKAMLTIKNELGINIGYSDHTLGIEVPIGAVALGAKVIEKHFTLDRSLIGPDHMASLEPNELKDMVIAIRNMEKAISGNGQKGPSESEKENIQTIRKSVYFSRGLQSGSIITEKDLICLRPGSGVSPMHWDNIIGRKVNIDVEKHTKFTWHYLL